MSFYTGPLGSNAIPTMAGNPMEVNQEKYIKAIMERNKMRTAIQPHTHNAQGQSVPVTEIASNLQPSFQPMGPLGNPGIGTMGTGFASDMPAISNPTNITDFNKYNDLVNFRTNSVPTGGK